MHRIVRFVVWCALIIGVVVGIARLGFLRWWRVPDDDPWLEASVAPTLRPGDLVLLWRFTPPSFGDLVLCPEPDAPERVVVGRLLGEEGDALRVKGERVRVNDDQAETERSCGEFEVDDPTSRKTVTQRCQVEVVAGHAHQRGSVLRGKPEPREVDVEVPEGKLFLISDNRLYPYDSRDYGPVDRSACTETVFFRLVSRNGFGDVENRLTFVR